MAGIGFELKKVFDKRGILAKIRGCGYAGAVSAGPMLLGIGLFAGVTLVAGAAGADKASCMLISAMVTTTLIFSMLISSLTSMIASRYVSDMIYEKKFRQVMPAFYGACTVDLCVGAVLFGAYLMWLDIGINHAVSFMLLFFELIVVWNEMNFLTIVHKYRGILLSFLSAAGLALTSALVLTRMMTDLMLVMELSILLGFGLLLLMQYGVLIHSLGVGIGSPFAFLRWMRRFPLLSVTGLLVNIGLYGPIFMMWHSDIQKQIVGNLYAAPQYDVAAMYAFLTILPTLIGFISQVETEFYPHYRRYFSRLNGDGSLMELEHAQEMMLSVLKTQLSQLGMIQIAITILSSTVLVLVLELLPLGFNYANEGYFRLLCIAYGLYSIANVLFLMLLYFADYRGAMASTGLFAVLSIGLTALSFGGNINLYGCGFLAASSIFLLAVTLRLSQFLSHLPYQMLSRQVVSYE